MLSRNIKFLMAAAVITVSMTSFAASPREIDEVRKKTSFTDADMAIVDSFINETFEEMLEAPTIEESVKRREEILVRKPKNGQTQYKTQFLRSVEENIVSSLRVIDTWSDEKFQKAMRLNLAVMVGSLDDPALYELAIRMLSADNIAVRYWALQALTGNDMVASIKSSPDSQRSQDIIEAVTGITSVNSPINLAIAAKFAGSIDAAQSNDMLNAIAQTRINAYQNNMARNESSDAVILQVMAQRMNANQQAKEALSASFTSLMAVSVKKYADSLVPGGALTDVSEQQLITLITEIEKNILPLFDINAELTKAIERRNAEDFQQAYNNIFGDGENQGELAAKING
jgi:hypothetical protein